MAVPTDLEPVNGAAVDESREAPEPVPKGVPDGTHGQNDVHLRAAALHKHVEERQVAAVRLLVAFALAVQQSHFLNHLLLLVNCKQVRHLEKPTAGGTNRIDLSNILLILQRDGAKRKKS